MQRLKSPRRFTAGVDTAFDSSEADIENISSLARHGHTFNATADYSKPDPEFAGPSFCFSRER